jgi:hypothetical protein
MLTDILIKHVTGLRPDRCKVFPRQHVKRLPLNDDRIVSAFELMTFDQATVDGNGDSLVHFATAECGCSPEELEQILMLGGSDSVYSFFYVFGFKASFGRKCLTHIDKRPVRNSDIQVKNAGLSGPIGKRRPTDHGSNPFFAFSEANRHLGKSIQLGASIIRAFPSGHELFEDVHEKSHGRCLGYIIGRRMQ